MGKMALSVSCVIAGSILGFLVGVASRCPIHILILLTLNGTFLGYLLGAALFWKQYSALVWGIAAVIIALIVDWVAGSTRVGLLDKLAFASAGLFISFDFRFFWKKLLVAGGIGALLGFVWGMTDSLWFGNAHLEPGLLSAALFSVKGFILAMSVGSFLMLLFGSKQAHHSLNGKGK